MNAASSRSHAVLSLSLTLRPEDGGGGEAAGAVSRAAKLHLIDLAGER